MNGFANSILSFLLSWIRALIANIWSVINSENGGALYQFLAANWLWIAAVLCVGGFVVDRIIYFVRWKPHYIWLSRLDRMRSRRREKRRQAEELYEQQTRQPVWNEPEEPAQPAYQPDAYAPTIQYTPAAAWSAPAQEADDWQFEDDAFAWDEPEMAFEAPIQQDAPAPPARSAEYYRDMQSGFAPAVPPQQLYAQPVHPGLNEDVLRQNIGLSPNGELPDMSAPVVHAPAFRPFTVQEEAEPVRTPGALSRLARRARDLVGMADDENAPSIHDLHTTVDVSDAFHEPVYPQAISRDDNDGQF